MAGTDGRDDVQLVVTVEDAAGRPISASPPVTLTIESGPGELPTGRTLTFDPDADIPIRDGQAAIEFRSYEGGDSVIRASSPGLADAFLTVATRGQPQFIPGQTPVAASHPYRRFLRADAPASAGPQNIAYGRPTAASSEASGHDGSRAVDDDNRTFWSAQGSPAGAWWQVDLEQPHAVNVVETTLAAPGVHRYRIDGSPDGVTWTLLVDRSDRPDTGQVRRDVLPGSPHCQFVRITFAEGPAAIAEVRIEGRHWP
jgi:hypothetical protein